LKSLEHLQGVGEVQGCCHLISSASRQHIHVLNKKSLHASSF